ncbi:MAG TPA: YdcF family protein [Acidimicrobiia bacterium]|nr:YdcF family protein [Acidimicrobiia bacterium]
MTLVLAPFRWVLRLHLLIQLVLLVFTATFLYVAVVFVQVWMASREDGAQPAQAIVVLGAAQYDGRPSPVFEARLDHAAHLYQEGIAPVVVVTGGKAEGDRFSEATAGADYLHTLGVPDHDILRETSGRNSWESLAASARFLRERGITEVVLVSDPFHAERIDAIASEVGLDGHVSPTRTSPISGAEEVQRLVGESVRVAVGRIIGFRRMMSLQDAADEALRPARSVLGALL